MTERLERELMRLQEPAPPASLSRIVMARVARLAEQRRPAFTTAPATLRERRLASWREAPAWATVLAGLAIVFVSWIDVFVSWIDGRLEVSSLRGLVSQVATPSVTSRGPNAFALLAFGVGLLLYVAGLFAPLARGNVRKR